MKLDRLRRRAARKQRKRERARRRRMGRVLDWLSDAPPAARGWEASIYSFSVPLSAQVYARLRAAPGAKRITVAIPASGATSKP